MKNADTALISIIIPMYKVERYIIRCLKSVVEQTYGNIEIIMIDDCGGDRSLEMGREYLDSVNVKYKYIVNEKQSGPSFSRNEGLKIAEGKYVFFLDSDDCIDKNCISILVSIMENQELEAELSFSDHSTFQSDENLCSDLKDFSVEKFKIRHGVDFVRKHGFMWGILYKMDVIRENNLRMPDSISYMEDNIWNLDYLECVDNDRIYYVKSKIYSYFLNPVSLSRPGKKEIIVQKTLDCLNYYENRFHNECGSADRHRITEMIESRRFFRNSFFNELYMIDHSIKSMKPDKYKNSTRNYIKNILRSDIGFFCKVCELTALIPFMERAAYKIKFRFFNNRSK